MTHPNQSQYTMKYRRKLAYHDKWRKRIPEMTPKEILHFATHDCSKEGCGLQDN